MSMVLLMWIVWAGMATAFLALLAYRGTITRYEDDQLFLTGNNENAHQLQEEIFRKVHRIEPAVWFSGVVSAVLTVGIVGMYVWDALKVL